MDEISPQLKTNIETRDRLNAVSLSFCLAKWMQGTLHLHRGLTHSCHHVVAHEIPLQEIKANVAALHNTKEKIETRKQMLNGERPAGCQYCWNIEDLSPDRFSDRIMKSQDAWAMPHIDKVLANPLSDKILPKYLEISFSRACNFKCSYCSPAFSTKWAQDVMQHGPYPGREYEGGKSDLEEPFTEETNPYIKAFWDWWPELKNSLDTLRITGGEPLLSPNTFKVLELLKQDPAPNLSFSINSNLGMPQAKVAQMIEGVGHLIDHNKIQKFHLYTSIEAWEERAEYIRNGLDTDLFWSNLELVLQSLPKVRITIMVTFNLLSVTSFDKLLENVLRLREKYSNQFLSSRLCVDIAYLRHPKFLAVNILPKEYQEKLRTFVDFLANNRAEKIQKRWGFFDFEEMKMRRTLQWMESEVNQRDIMFDRADFYNYFTAHDKRRGTDFLKTFPEMKEFWELCRELSARVAAGNHDDALLFMKRSQDGSAQSTQMV